MFTFPHLQMVVHDLQTRRSIFCQWNYETPLECTPLNEGPGPTVTETIRTFVIAMNSSNHRLEISLTIDTALPVSQTNNFQQSNTYNRNETWMTYRTAQYYLRGTLIKCPSEVWAPETVRGNTPKDLTVQFAGKPICESVKSQTGQFAH